MSEPRLLWEGAPEPRRFRGQTMALPWIAGYVAVLAVWAAIAGSLKLGLAYGAAGLAVLAVFAGLGHLMARATHIRITDRAVELTYGVALPKTLRIPLSRIATVDYRPGPRGTGDIILTLADRTGLAAPLLWPNVALRGLRLQPALRAIPGAADVARQLATALTASEAPAAATVPRVTSMLAEAAD